MVNNNEESWFTKALKAPLIGYTHSLMADFFIRLGTELAKLIVIIVRFLEDNLNPPLVKAQSAIIDTWESKGLLDANDVKVLKSFGSFPAIINLVTIPTFIVVAIVIEIFNIVMAATGTLRQTYNKKFSPIPPTPETVLPGALRVPEMTGKIREAMQRAGLDDKDIDLMFYSLYQPYPIEVIREIFYRTNKDIKWAQDKLMELGFTPNRVNDIIETWKVIPSPSDIATMVGREAFEPDSIEIMGLLDEFPTEVSPWWQKQGLDKYWQEKIWISHWQQPSLEMGFRMYQREVINKEQLEFLFRTVEIPPFWRDKLLAIAYNPLTRVDARRMYEDGSIDRDRLKRAYLDLGYNEENAELYTNWTIRYTQRDRINTAKTEVLRAYKDRNVPRDEALDYLVNAGLSPDDSEHFLALADYHIEKEMQDEEIGLIGDLYIDRAIDDRETIVRLGKLNLPALQSDFLMRKWTTKRITTEALPSKADLHKWAIRKIITKERYWQFMRRARYSEEVIDYYWQLVEAKKEPS